MAEDAKTQMLAIFRAELLWFVVLVLGFVICWQLATIREKINALEDAVFIFGIYERQTEEDDG